MRAPRAIPTASLGALLLLFGASASAQAPGSSLPPGFQKTTLAAGLAEPTAIAFAPDGRLLVAERAGAIRVIENGDLLPQPLIQIQADTTQGERGLLGLALDPDFAANGWLYAFYTTGEPRSRVGRFTVVGSAASPASEFLVWQNPDLCAVFHQGGGIRFGPDGNLYIGTGDQFFTPNAQILFTQHGKILRLTPTGAIPPDNPFAGIAGAEAAIWAYGLRNPFRFSFDSLTGQMWIGDVGGNTPTSWEEIDAGVAGANYGWPIQEGDACYIPSCSAATSPAHSYRHDDGAYSALSQGCVIVGPVYRGGAFPPEYGGNLFVADYANGWIRRIVLGPGGSVAADLVFEAAPDAGTVVDLAVGSDGALTYVTNGIPWVGATETGTVQRIAWIGAGNQAPVAVASASPAQGPAPLAVQFSSAGSSDPDAGPSPLSFVWDFGDGTTSCEPDPTHVYLEEGPHTASLTASDSAAQGSVTLPIAVGSPPTAEILAPPPGTTYRAGDRIDFQGSGEDPETGTLPASSLSWQVVLVHESHAHPFLGPLPGVSAGGFTVPASGHPPGDSHFEIRLTASDPSGLSGSDVRTLVPIPTTLVFDSVPSGVPFFLDGQPETTPQIVESLAGFEHEVRAPAVGTVDGSPLGFECWSDGGGITHALVAPEGGMNLTVGYASVPTQTATFAVTGLLRNAEHSPLFGQEPADPSNPLAICWGRNAAGPLQAGFEFLLQVPHGAFVAEARLRMLAAYGQFLGPISTIRAYDVGVAPPFDPASDTPLAEWAPLTATSVGWAPPIFEPGAFHESPDLSPLLQAVVDRDDWAPGNAFGLVLDGSPTVGAGWRCVTNFYSMVPPLLEVTWALPPPPGGGCTFACGFSTYGLGAAPPPTLGLLGTGSPRVGGAVVLTTTGIPSSGTWTLISLEPASLPLAGGLLLVNPGLALAAPFLPSSGGEASWTVPVPQDPVLVGLPLHLQSVAPDPGASQGFAFSAGLRAILCP